MFLLPVLWSYVPNIAIVSDTSKRSHNDIGNCFVASWAYILEYVALELRVGMWDHSVYDDRTNRLIGSC